jgi:dephospho-CoA kinase
MLRVGLLEGPSMATVRGRLVELGARRWSIHAPVPSLDDHGVLLVDLDDNADDAPLTHLDITTARAGATADVTIDRSDTEDDLAAAVVELWRDRLEPFEENLRARRRAPRRRRPVLASPGGTWDSDAARLIARLRTAVGPVALRIDHIGSTSVPGLRAKDLIDIQVTVKDLRDAARAAESARDAGFVHVDGEWFGEDRFGASHPEEVAVDADPGRPTNVNFRPMTAPVWRDALLFRDWLRAHPQERASYEAMKVSLAADGTVGVDRYSEDKMPWIHAGLERAERWATETGWSLRRS